MKFIYKKSIKINGDLNTNQYSYSSHHIVVLLLLDWSKPDFVVEAIKLKNIFLQSAEFRNFLRKNGTKMHPILNPSLDVNEAERGDWADGGDCGCAEEFSSSFVAPGTVNVT